ncbi:MAG: GntG family PLP-dependent aldolase [Fuerstiella sp.]
MIDLRSDTVTRPTVAMKNAMMAAEVGDDMMGEDPTVNRLESMVAELLGKEAAVFACSGTQSNQMAIRAHCVPGDELLINVQGHIGIYEGGGPAALSGVSVRQLAGEKGFLTVNDLQGTVRPDDQHYCRTRLLCLENTTNLGGGYVYDLDQLQQLSDWATENGLKRHLDGARFFNATIAAGYSPAQLADCFDTVSICFSKGLGCPMGSILVGSKAEMRKARRARKMFGGSLRQAGFLAAAAIYALENHVDRLQLDHDNAKELARGLQNINGISANVDETETNLVYFEVDPELATGAQLAAELSQRCVKLFDLGPQRLRAVTHLDIQTSDIPNAVDAVEACVDTFTR